MQGPTNVCCQGFLGSGVHMGGVWASRAQGGEKQIPGSRAGAAAALGLQPHQGWVQFCGAAPGLCLALGATAPALNLTADLSFPFKQCIINL